ncbi:ketol-acid reductoisomerase [Sphingosinicella ginsenosidimutans]|uniref:Ketol-acid reductoisomerase (NADP(+)) n=1 Tax=Allosphingosinicella ginsenosidimutans TaxID=1176539 RepID=A0A5C6TW49_9SPHN|nr:ketol-acid reductoisomerase [Sphingosinicella ginsenosidimutans]TXC64151.1 ketol-acid reductoisomerase [Sphingosinicella ginsenosidimutans]
MERIYTNDDASPAALKDGTIAIVGYGSQGRAHARNLRDSGFDVIVGARPDGKAAKRAAADGFRVFAPAEAARAAKLVALLTPDMSHRAVYEEAIAPNLASRATLLVAHGFSIQYKEIAPRDDIDIVLVAPKGPGDLVRREYEIGRGVPCLFAVHQDASGAARARALAYTQGIGGTTAGAIETSFAEETETDLFGEQAVLCGGATELVTAGYETLVDAGYQPAVAYFECLHELKLIVDLLYEGGIAKMHEFISETAKYGDLVSGPRVVNDETRARMREILGDIQSGAFARDWIEENRAGKPRYRDMLDADLAQPIEQVGARLRAHMAWLQSQPASKAA